MRWSKRLICLGLAMLLMGSSACAYSPTNRDTRMDGAPMVITDVDLSAYTLLYETDTCAYWFRDDRDVIAVRDHRTGYVWKTGLDAGFSSDIKAAVKAADTPEALALAAEPIEKSLNARYIGIANSLLTAEYYDAETVKYTSSAAEEGASSTLSALPEPGAFALQVRFEDIDLNVRVTIQFGEASIRYGIAFEDISGTGLSVLSALWLTPFLGASGGEAQYYDFEAGKYGDAVPKPALSGYVFVPDGSGSLIRFQDNTVAFTEYIGEVYGGDAATHTYYYSGATDAVAVKTPVMPVFGIAHGQRQAAFVAYAESGAEHMSIVARPDENLRIKYTWAYPRFEYNSTYFRVYNRYGDGYFTLMSEPNRFDVSMTYAFLANDQADWTGMARAYRAHLIQTGSLPERDMTGDVPLRVDFILSDIKKSLMGTEQVIVTSLEDVNTILDGILSTGITNVTTGLKGWQRGAETLAKPDSYAFASGIGSEGQYTALARTMAERGVTLSLQRDFSLVNETMLRFRGSAAQHVNTWFVIRYAGALYQNAPVTMFGLAAPETAAGWLRSQIARDNALTLTGITETLCSTFTRYGCETSVTQAIELYRAALDDANAVLYMRSPNLYLWPYMSGYINAPVTGSQYVFETDTVPFLQMVLYSRVDAYAPYCNFSNYTRADQLRMIDYNVYPSFILSQQPSYLLADTLSSDLYSTEYAQYKPLIDEIYRFVGGALAPVRGWEWTGRTVPMEGVTVNTYELNGQSARIIINYTDEAVTVDGARVEALDCLLITDVGGEAL